MDKTSISGSIDNSRGKRFGIPEPKPGERFDEGIAACFARAGIKGRATGLGSLRRIHLTDAPLSDYRSTLASEDASKRVTKLAKLLFEEGVIIAGNGLMCFSTPMTGDDIDEILGGFDRALARLDSAS